MKLDMRRMGLALVAASLALLPMARAQAQSNAALEPAVVFSISSVDDQLADLRHLMTAADMEGMADLATEMAKGFTDPFDTTKPIGGYLHIEDGMPKVVAFLPVNDLDAALKLVADQLGEIEEDGDMTIASLPNGENLFIKQANGFAFMSNESANLDSLPENPRGLLDGMSDTYNFAVRVYVDNIPQEMKDMAIGFMEQGFNEATEDLEDANPEAARFQKEMNAASMQSMVEAIQQTETLTVGVAVDEEAKATYLDLTFTAKPNTKLAEQIKTGKSVESRFTGFLMKDSAASLHFASKMSEDDIAQVDQMFGNIEGMKSELMDGIAEEQNLNPMQREVVEGIFTDMLDIMKATAKGGVFDGGAVVMLDDKMTLAGGMTIADGEKMEALVKELVGMAQQEAPDEVTFELDKETYEGVKLHVITAPVPEDEEDAAKMFGDQVVVVVGTSKDAFYVAAGDEPVALLKKCMAASKQSTVKDLPNSQFNLELGPIMRFAASVEDNLVTAVLADALEDSELDRVSITSVTEGNSARTRILLEDDVIKLIGIASSQLGGEMGPGF